MNEEDPRRTVARVELSARRVVTPCPAGSMVWRVWGQGRPLVLLHGASGTWTHWIRNVLPLARRFRVCAADMPGFGDSDGPPEPHTADGLADLIVSGIDGLLPPPAPLDLAGFSFGSIIAGLVAARLGPRVGRLTLVGAGGLAIPRPPMPALLRIEPDMAPDAIARAHRENLRRLMIADPAQADDLAVFVHRQNIRRARFRSGSIPESDALLRALPAIRARLGGFWGERDAFAWTQLAEYRRVLASGRSDADLRVIPGAGHWAIYEAADRANAALLEMLGAGAAPEA